MSRARILLAVVAVAAVGLIVYFLVRSDPGEETAVVERGSIDVTIDTVGMIEVREAQILRAEVGGTVAALGAEAGDAVESGDIVVLLDGDELAQAVEAAERALEAAEFDLQFAELRREDDEDSITLQQDAIEALGRVELAREAVEDANANQANVAIVADRPGTVLELLVQPGDRVTESQPVARLYSPDDLILIADVDELDLPNVRPGAEVRFRLDSFPATNVDGSIVSTAPAAVQRGGATLFPAEVEFTAPEDLDIRPGMNADVTIITDLRENVLLVPEQALRTVGRRVFVEVQRNGDFEEVEVVLGYRAAGVAEVVDGLEEGNRVRLQ